MDIFSPKKRSEIMSRVRSSGTRPECLVRDSLRKAGFRLGKESGHLPYKPDVLLPKYRTVIFVHGCFWHGHDCARAKLPATNSQFWRTKIAVNKRRDARATRALRKLGWHCMHIWGCRIEFGTNRIIRRLNTMRDSTCRLLC
jgi:DNA mismatch endonuclease (patch repair protein)